MAVSHRNSVLISPLDRLNSLVYLHWSLVLHVHNRERAIQQLTNGLSRVATAVPYLKGHVSYPEKNEPALTTRLELSWGPDDADLVLREHVLANQLPDLATMRRQNAPAHFFPTDIISLPLFVPVTSGKPQPVFEATYINIDGGLVLNMCVHHGVMDGRGLATVTELWAEFTRLGTRSEKDMTGSMLLTKLPMPDEPCLRTRKLVEAAGLDEETKPNKPLKELVDRYEADHAFGHDLMALLSITAAGPKCGSHIFTFSGHKIERAKNILSREADLAEHSITTNSVLHAVIWSTITRLRLCRRAQRPPTSVSRCSLAVDGRSRLAPAISEDGPYLGNVVLISSVDLSLEVLETAGRCASSASPCSLAPVIKTIANATKRITKDHIAGLLSALQQVGDTSDVGPGWLSPHRINFMSSSWANLPLYECDFGPEFSELGPAGSGGGDGGDAAREETETPRGNPVFVRYPYAEYNDGNVVVLPRRRKPAGEEEAIEAYVMLAEDDLLALGEDDVFRSWLLV
ncbi:trichothecene 8-O-acetyltransferase [Xylariaceae sp. FL1651]|nr:trichothecene 8-O-acetyltransferase [Xylariaceae sp. FL1651]